MGDIGNVDLELRKPPSASSVTRTASSKSFMRFQAADGDDGQRAEVFTVYDLSRIEMGNAAGFGKDVVGKDARELMLANHHLDVDTKIIVSPEDFNHAAYGWARGRGPTGDLDIDDEAVHVA